MAYTAPNSGSFTEMSGAPAPPQQVTGIDPTLDRIMDGIDDEDEAPCIIPIEEQSPTDGLQFQDFKPTDSSVQGQINPHLSVEAHAQAIPSSRDTDALMASPGTGEEPPAARFYDIQYYKIYFDVDTTDIASRLTKAMSPFNNKFIEEVAPAPDLYGPFWVCTTLIFAMAAAGNFANYLDSAKTTPWTYDFNKVTFAAFMVYGYGTGLPLLINLAAMYYSEAIGFVQLVCVYGYSFTVFIIASFLCVLPSEILRWLFVIGAFVVSGGMIWGNLGQRLENVVPGKGKPVMIGLVALHALVSLMFKIYFFEYL